MNTAGRTERQLIEKSLSGKSRSNEDVDLLIALWFIPCNLFISVRAGTLPSGPTMLAMRSVTRPPPQPTSTHFIPFLKPTVFNS
jgi:hypothetical protein